MTRAPAFTPFSLFRAAHSTALLTGGDRALDVLSVGLVDYGILTALAFHRNSLGALHGPHKVPQGAFLHFGMDGHKNRFS
jgi:hypothetical protein